MFLLRSEILKRRLNNCQTSGIHQPTVIIFWFLIHIQGSLKFGDTVKNEQQIANEAYSNMEYEIRRTGKNAVLVSVDSVAELKKAYPNYFLDTALFLELVDWAIK